MKIEMGENLFYSWLRHVKGCTIVQNNWKTSPKWNPCNMDDVERLKEATDKRFSSYEVFKKNSSVAQIMQQGECDAIGIEYVEGTKETNIIAVDVAFHEGGLNYGPRSVTVAKILEKYVRTAMCLLAYMSTKNAELIFASPKINPAVYNELSERVGELNVLFTELGYGFVAKLIANEDFDKDILGALIVMYDEVADTTELFMRSYKLLQMFSRVRDGTESESSAGKFKATENKKIEKTDVYSEIKIGRIVQTVLRRILSEGKVSDEELLRLQDKGYSRETFRINFPVLVKEDSEFDKIRYYVDPVEVRGTKYRICSQWFETPSNNDRPYLIKWIEEHG